MGTSHLLEIQIMILEYFKEHETKYPKIKGILSPFFWMENDIKQEIIETLMAQARFAKAGSNEEKKYQEEAKKYMIEIIQANKDKEQYVSDLCYAKTTLYYYFLTKSVKSFRLSERAFTKYLMHNDSHIKDITKGIKTYTEAGGKIKARVYYEMAKVFGEGSYKEESTEMFGEAYKQENIYPGILTDIEKNQSQSLDVVL
jgi:hypothetical protein